MNTLQKKHSLVLRLTAVLAFGLAAGASFGYDPGDYSTWMQLKGTSVRYTGSVWYDPADATQTGVPAVADKCYYVAAEKTVNSEDANDEFPGVMAVAGWLNLSKFSTTHTLNDLTLLDGSTLKTTANVTHKGKVTVKGTVRYDTTTYSARTWYINADFYGADDAVLNMGNAKDIGGKCADTVSIGGTWSNYAGTLNFTKGTYFSLANAVSPFGGTMVVQSNAWVKAAKTSGTFEVGGLRFENGGVLMFGGATVQYVISKKMEIVGGATLDVAMPANSDHLDLFKLTGEAAQNPPDVSSVTVGFVNQQGKLASDPHFVIVDNGDGTKTVRIAWTETVIRGTRYVFNPTTTPVPNSFRICSDAILELGKKSGAYDVESLAFEDGAELCAPSANYDCAYFNVSTAISFGETFKISGLGISTNGYRIARLTGEAAANAPDVSSVQVELLDKAGELPRNPRLEIVDNGDGTKDVRLAYDPIKIMIKNNSYNLSCWTAGATDCWLDQEVPGTDYAGDVYTKSIMYFSLYSNMIYNDLTLTVHGTALHADSYGLTLKQINFVGTCDLDTCHGGSAQTHIVYAPIRLHDANLTLKGNSSSDRWGRVEGAIDGSGSITIYSSGTGTWKVNSDMTGFTGDVRYSGNNGEVEERPGRYVEFMGKSPFGGDYEGAEPWKAVQFTGMPWVYVSGTVGMTNVQRGTFVSGHVNLEVAAGKSLTLGGLSTTYGGTLMKRGAGALVLASEAKFAAAGVQQDTPIADTNNLVIAAGTLEVAAVDAVNGLAVSFGPEASLVVNVGAAGDLKTYGARNVKWETPFAAEAAIPVAFTGEMAADSDTFAICTISETAAVPTFTVPAKYAHRKVTALGWRTNDDGSKTYEVALEKQGILLIVR